MDLPVSTETRAGVFRITLNRPDVHNAFDEGTVEALRQAAERAASAKDIFAVLIAGTGPSFCSGADLAWMKELGTAGGEENRRSAERLVRLFRELDRLERPIVGRIHGSAFGGGVGLVALCDISIAAASAKFAMSEVRLGLVPAVVAPYVIRKIGSGRARDLFLTGRRVGAAEAAAIGLVSRVVDDSILDAAVEAVLSDLRKGGPQAIARTKELVAQIEVGAQTPEHVARWTGDLLTTVRASDEARAGMTAFLEKGRPPWVARWDEAAK